MSSANKNLDLIRKINVSLLTSENSNYKQIKTIELKNSVNKTFLNIIKSFPILYSIINLFKIIPAILRIKKQSKLRRNKKLIYKRF